MTTELLPNETMVCDTVPQRDWEKYYRSCDLRNNGRNLELLDTALPFCSTFERALDVGSGTSVASIAMIKSGFRSVTAVDASPDAEHYSRVAKVMAPGVFSFARAWFHEYDFGTGRFDLVHADVSLPYSGISHFPDVLRRVAKSIREGGVFAGTFFGNGHFLRDRCKDVVFISASEIVRLLEGIECAVEDVFDVRHEYRLHHVVVIGKKL